MLCLHSPAHQVVAVVHGQEKASFLRNMGVDSVIDAAALKQPLNKAVKAAAPKGTCAKGADQCWASDLGRAWDQGRSDANLLVM